MSNKLTDQQEKHYKEYGIYVGMDVVHKNEDSFFGIVKSIDDNLPGVTTCSVLWLRQYDQAFDDSDNPEEFDTVWTNKLQQTV